MADRAGGGGAKFWRTLTERGRRAVQFAQNEATERGENLVKTEHLLLGILREDDNTARRLLASLGVAPDELARQTEALLVPGPGRDESPLRLDGRAATALENAVREANRVGHRFVGPEHLLLGIIAAQVGTTGIVFQYHGPELDAARRALDGILGGEHPRPEALAAAGRHVAQAPKSARVKDSNLRWVMLVVALAVLYLWMRAQ